MNNENESKLFMESFFDHSEESAKTVIGCNKVEKSIDVDYRKA
jgi:hypothetical protein